MSKIKEYVRHLAVVAMATLLAQCAWAAATPKLLINFAFNATPEVDGWHRHFQNGGSQLGGASGITVDGIKFSTTGAGNFYERAKVTGDFQEGTYTGIDGTSYTSLTDEIVASLGFGSKIAFTEDVYKTGLMNGGQSGNTATIEGLSAAKKYAIYLGYGLLKSDGTSQQSGFSIASSGYGSVGRIEYVTSAQTSYQTYTSGLVKPASQQLMVVRLVNVVPTAAGQVKFTLGGDRSGMNWLVVAEMPTSDKLTATLEGDTSFDSITWDEGATWEEESDVALTATTDLTLTMGTEIPGLVEINGEGKTVTIRCVSDNLPTIGGTATIKYLFDATDEAFSLSAATLEKIRTSGLTYTFKGTTDNGVTLDYGTTTGTQMESHLVFESGKHAMTYGNDNSKLFATGHSNADPTILVKNGAILDLTAKDLSGWSGGADVSGVIRVNKGGTLNILQSGDTTFFYRQRLILEPGSKVTHNFNKASNGEGRFRWQGGTDKSKAQIYMMDYAEDKTNDPAIIEQLGDSQLLLASDATRGLAIYVGAKAKLQIKSKVYVHLANNNAALAKYGEGTLELMGGATLYDVNIAEGLVKFNEDTDEHAVTISNSATGTGTLEFTKSEVTLGQNYRTMKLVLPTSATLNLTASTAEIADGAITLKTAMSADDFATLTVAVVNSASEEIEHETISVAEDGTVTIPLVTQGVTSSCAVSSWNSDWSGEVVVKGTAEAPTTITVDAAYPTGVTAVKVIGNVTLAYAEGATASTVSIQPQSGAVVTVSGTPADAIVYAPVNGSTTTFATGSSIKLASGSAINGTVTIAKGATVELTAGSIINTSRAYELHNHGTLELGGTQQQIQTANNNLQTFTQKLVFYSGSVTHGTRSSQAMEIKGGYSYRFFVGYDADAETPIATIDCDLGVSEWDTINCDFQIAQNAGLSLKSVSDAGTVSVSGTVINGLSIGNANNKAVALSANEKGLRGNVVIGAGTTLVLGGSADDRISYDTAPIAAFDIAGTLQCDRRQTIAANGKAASVTLRNGGSITGNGTANGQGFTCGLDVYNAFTIMVDGIATISTPISITGVDQVITIEKTAESEAAALTLSGGVTGQNSGKIKLTEGTSLVVSEELADGKVITDVEGKRVAFDEATLTYSLIPAEITFTLTTLPEHAVAYIQINNGETTPIEGGTFTATPGDKFVVWFTPAEGYVGNTLSTGVVTVVYPMQTTEIQSPTAELMNIRPVVAIAAVGEPSMQPETQGFGSLAEAIAAGWYVFLTDAVTVDSTIVIDHSVVIDLQGHNVTGNGVRVFQVKSGTVEIDSTDADSGEVISATISTTGEINPDSSVIRIGGGDASAAPELTIDEGVTISSAICYGITAFGVGTQTLVVDGTVSTTGNRPAISGNGNASNGETTITINGTVSATAENAIYQPQAGTTTINGTVTGGIEAKAGTVTIKTGATVSARETTATHTANGDGCSTQGYAVAVVDNAGYKGGAVVTIEGGTITGPVAQVVDSEAKKANMLTITGGTFTVDPSAYVAEGYEATESEGVWTVSEKTGPKSWDEVKDDDVATIVTDLPEGKTVTATELTAWAKANEVAFQADITVPVNALIFYCKPEEIPTDVKAEADKALKQVAVDMDLLALMKEATEKGSVTIPAPDPNPYPLAIFKLVPATLGDGVVTTAELFKLSIELK